MPEKNNNQESIESLIKQTRFKDNFEKAIINVIYTANYFRDIHLQVFKPYKIQSQHFNILRILRGKYPEPISPGYIKEVMLDKGRDITRLVDKLEILGLVKRANCDKNKRKVNISLTKFGVQKVDEITEKFSEIHDDMKKLSDAEYHKLSQLLDKIR